jgi:hypothetical protein
MQCCAVIGICACTVHYLGTLPYESRPRRFIVTRLCPISSSTLVRNLPLPTISNLIHITFLPSDRIEVDLHHSFIPLEDSCSASEVHSFEQTVPPQSLLPNYGKLATSPITTTTTTTTRSRSRSISPRSNLKFCETDPRQWLRPRYIPLQGVLSVGSCSSRSSSILGRIPAVTKRGTILAFSYMPACFVVVEL